MQTTSLYKKQYHIDISNVDFNKKLKLSALFGFFQDIASEAVENLGIGINKLEKEFSVTWILTRIRVDISRIPSWNESITISTWPQEPRRLDFERDFIVKDMNDNIIIRAVSTWVIIDIKTRELRETEYISIKYPPTLKERAIDCRLGKIRTKGELQKAYQKVVGYSDVDFNGHINNSRYIDFISDCFTLENHMKYNTKSIEVNYINESLPGDTITLYRDLSGIDSNIIIIEGINEKDNRPVFISKIEIAE